MSIYILAQNHNNHPNNRLKRLGIADSRPKYCKNVAFQVKFELKTVEGKEHVFGNIHNCLFLREKIAFLLKVKAEVS